MQGDPHISDSHTHLACTGNIFFIGSEEMVGGETGSRSGKSAQGGHWRDEIGCEKGKKHWLHASQSGQWRQ